MTFAERVKQLQASTTVMPGDAAAIAEIAGATAAVDASTVAMKALTPEAVAEIEAMVKDETDAAKFLAWVEALIVRGLSIAGVMTKAG